MGAYRHVTEFFITFCYSPCELVNLIFEEAERFNVLPVYLKKNLEKSEEEWSSGGYIKNKENFVSTVVETAIYVFTHFLGLQTAYESLSVACEGESSKIPGLSEDKRKPRMRRIELCSSSSIVRLLLCSQFSDLVDTDIATADKKSIALLIFSILNCGVPCYVTASKSRKELPNTDFMINSINSLGNGRNKLPSEIIYDYYKSSRILVVSGKPCIEARKNDPSVNNSDNSYQIFKKDWFDDHLDPDTVYVELSEFLSWYLPEKYKMKDSKFDPFVSIRKEIRDKMAKRDLTKSYDVSKMNKEIRASLEESYETRKEQWSKLALGD